MLTPEQIQQRLSYVTGSDAGVICGVNPWQTQVQLWGYKTRRAIAEDISEKVHVKAGNMLEEAVAKWFTHETGKEFYRDDKFFIHKDVPFLGGNIDAFIKGENALLECKTASNGDEWGEGFEHGDNRIPDHYLTQVIHYCAVSDRDIAYIAVLIRGIDFRWFKYERNAELEKQIIDKEIAWWNDYIVADVAPPPVVANDIKLLLSGKVSDETMQSDTNISIAIDSLNYVQSSIKELKETEEKLIDEICIYMKDKQTLLNLDGKVAVTWKQRPGSLRFDSKSFKEKHPEIYKQFEKRGDLVRTFLLKK